jgi:succinyl-CoA synthetase alpha subunit
MTGKVQIPHPILRKGDRVLVQGMTGKQGSFWTERMIAYGTNVVGGVNPKRAGETHLGLPVFGSACEAMERVGFDATVMFVPPVGALEAARDAIEAGAKVIVVLTEYIPLQDVMRMHALARRRAAGGENGVRIVGPNTAGLVTPGECFTGIMPAFIGNMFREGSVGVVSRSGSLGALVCLNLTQAGLGQSAFIGVGGDPVIGTTTLDAVMALEEDEKTEAIVIVGEIGGAMEEEAAAYLKGRGEGKPVVAFIAGRSAPKGAKMGHAGAIVEGGVGGYDGKRRALEEAGVRVADTPGELPGLVKGARQV